MVDRNDGKLDGVGRPNGEVSGTMSANLAPCDDVNDQNDIVIVSEEYVEVLAPAPQWTCMALQRGLTLFSDLMSRVFFHGQNELVAHLLRHVTGDRSSSKKFARKSSIATSMVDRLNSISSHAIRRGRFTISRFRASARNRSSIAPISMERRF